MEIILFIFCGIILGFIITFLFLKFFKKEKKEKISEIGLNLVLQQINELAKTIDSKLHETHSTLNELIRKQAFDFLKVYQEVIEKLTKIDETGKQISSFTQQLQEFQEILKNPKQRGVLGEYYLEAILKNILPPNNYKMQYRFSNGDTVDAVIFVKEKIIPIDSKFSLENYNRILEEKDPIARERLEKTFINDLKFRIQETSKYIRPEEKTTDFAFMFIPHEAIYYDLLVTKIGVINDQESQNLIQKALSKYRVIIVSPTTLLAYLQTILQGLRELQIEKYTQEIINKIENLKRHLSSYESFYRKLGNTLEVAIKQYESTNAEWQKIEKDFLAIEKAKEIKEIKEGY